MASADEILAAREPIGWRLGLERMRRLCSLLGMPQHRFASIHVVGTNGKTSVTLMTAALLEARGVSAGAYVSPHIRSWRERVVIHGEPISADAFARVLARAEEAAQVADRSAGDEGPVTQYELLTAAAFLAFAEARVEFAVIEAGLGGRLDATNVIPSKLTVLTSIGLDHTEWLGDTLEQIAAEKLAVLRDHTVLLTGALPPEVEEVVGREVERRHARRKSAIEIENLVPGFQAWNLSLAKAAVDEVGAGGNGSPEGGVARQNLPLEWLAIARSVPGRAEVVPGDPLQVFDAAHNPDGARALAAALPELIPPRRVRRWFRARLEPREVVCCLAIVADKDAKGIVDALAGVCSHFVCTEIPEEAIRGSGRPSAASHPAEALASLCRQAGADAEAVEDPLRAWERARGLARERGAAALAAGSHYLLACLWTERPAPNS